MPIVVERDGSRLTLQRHADPHRPCRMVDRRRQARRRRRRHAVRTERVGFLGVSRPGATLRAAAGHRRAPASSASSARPDRRGRPAHPAEDGRRRAGRVRLRRARPERPDLRRRRRPDRRRGDRGQIPDSAADGMSQLVTLLMLIAVAQHRPVRLQPHPAAAAGRRARRRRAVGGRSSAAIARLRDRPDPGHVDVAKALPVAYAVSLGAHRDVGPADLRRHRQPGQARRLTSGTPARSCRPATGLPRRPRGPSSPWEILDA